MNKRFSFFGLLLSTLFLSCLTLLQPRTTVAVVDENSPYGINIMKSSGESSNPSEDFKRKAYEYLRDAGIKWVRDSHGRGERSITSWARVEPQEGQWQWEKTDQDLILLKEYGLTYLGFIGKPPSWAQVHDPAYDEDGKNPDGEYPQDLNKFSNYVEQLVRRYGCNGGTCQIKYWEVGNEPNNNAYYLDHPEKYVYFLKRVYNTIKSNDPQAQVLLGGLGSNGIEENNFHDIIFQNYQAANYFDIYNFHAFGSGDVLSQFLDRGLAIRNRYCPEKPVWLTETAAWASSRTTNWQSTPETEAKQAENLLQYSFNIPFSKSIEKIFWFRYKDSGANPSSRWGTVGILRDNLNPKPAYFAYQTKTNSGPPPTKISGSVWIDTNSNGLQEVDEKTYSCSGNQTKIKLALFTFGNLNSPYQEKEMETGVFSFNNLSENKYHLRFSQLPVCNGVLYEPTQWRIDTAPSLNGGWRIDVSNYQNNGTKTDANDSWNSTPFWSLKVIKEETTHVYLGIRPGGPAPTPSVSPTPSPLPTPTPTPTPTPLPTPTPPPPNSITGFIWIDNNGDGRYYWDIENGKEMVYSCSGTQTKPQLALYKIGTPETPLKTMTLTNGYFTFTNLGSDKYHLKISQLPVCNGTEHQATKWQIKTAPSDGSLVDVSEYDEGPGTKADAIDTWTTTPFWSLKVNSGEITQVYLCIKPK